MLMRSWIPFEPQLFVEYKWEVKETMKKNGIIVFFSIYDMNKDEI